MKLKRLALLLVPAALTFVGCSDYDNGYDERAIAYDADFAKTFGKTDPNQDWSLASTVKANVTVGNNPSVIIYSDKPGHAGSIVLGVVNGKSATFNGIKGSEQVYAIATENGKALISGYYNVIDGVVNINNAPVGKLNAKTRADGNPTLGAKLFTHVAWDAESTWDGETWLYENQLLRLSLEEDGKYYFYYAPNTSTKPRKLAHNYSGTSEFADLIAKGDAGLDNTGIWEYYSNNTPLYYADDNSLAKEKGLNFPGFAKIENGKLVMGVYASHFDVKQHYDAPFYRISDTQTTSSTWVIGDCKTLFWVDDACFLESEDYRSSRKQSVYAKYGATVESLSKGVEFTTVRDNQNINIPMMYGATVKQNVFGYYYYTDDQDPRAVNRYVLFDDASPTANIKINGKAVSGMELAGKSGNDDDVVTCVTRRLAYFGKDGKGTGTYDFPKDVHIGFFIMKKYAEGDDWSGLTGTTALESWSYSSPSLNKRYFYNESGLNSTMQQSWGYRYGNDASISNNYGTVGVDGRVKAITWKYNNKILVGFGDDSCDEDLNDFVFWYDSEVKPEEEPEIHITTEELETSWIFACEDLGDIYDYDFNDIVWEVAQKYEDVYTDGVKTDTKYGNIEIRVLASGGTLPVEIVYDEVALGETHQHFGQQESEKYTPVNVGTKITNAPVTIKTIPATTQMDINSMKDKFKVKVSGKNGEKYYVTAPTISSQYSGNDSKPQMIILPRGWEWPRESVFINDAYPEFTNWAQNATWGDWSTNRDESKTTQSPRARTADAGSSTTGSSTTGGSTTGGSTTGGSTSGGSTSGGSTTGGESTNTKLTLYAKTDGIVKIGTIYGQDWNGYKIIITEGNTSNIPDGTYVMSFNGTATGACIRTLNDELVATNNGGDLTFNQDVLKQLINQTAYIANSYGNSDFSTITMEIKQQ